MRGVARSRNTCGGLLLQHRPVERVVVLVVERPEEDPVELAEVHVVRRLLEPQAAAVVEVHGELCGEALAQHLCILNSNHMNNGFQIIARAFIPQQVSTSSSR